MYGFDFKLMWAIVPVKDMVVAKQRLSTFLDAKERQNLFHSMLTDVLTALHNSLCFDGIAIITRDQKAINLEPKKCSELI